MIELTRVTKRRGTAVALDDVSLVARPGTVTALLGPAGAGKSTMLRIVLGLEDPTSGTALVNGRAPRRDDVRTATEHVPSSGPAAGITYASIGDPPAIVLDEPGNGLDLDGILWLRDLLTGLAADGRTVLFATEAASEAALLAQHVVVLAAGRIVAERPSTPPTGRAHGYSAVPAPYWEPGA
jgi:ABC-2 type transport system ATP-binding protein